VARKQQTLKYWFEGNLIRVPNVTGTGNSRHSWMMDILGFLREIAEGRGSRKLTDGDNSYWQAELGEHEVHVMTRWLAWHAQYEKVATMPELFVVPVDTEEVKA